MGRKLKFDFHDIFYAGRIAFSIKKMGIHFLGIALMYAIYEILVYLSLLIVGGSVAGDFWGYYGLRPALPISAHGVPLFTTIVMWVGIVIAFVIFFFKSTMVSKIAIQQLRGDEFYSMGDAKGFAKEHLNAIFGPILFLIGIMVFIAIFPVVAALLAMISSWVGDLFIMLATIILIPGFFLGVFLVYVAVILKVSLFFTPSITGVVGEDSFETIYQTFSIVWNQPWRIVVYEFLLLVVKIICVPILAAFSVFGFGAILFPLRLFAKPELKTVLSTVNGWLGSFGTKSIVYLNTILSTINEWAGGFLTKPINTVISISTVSENLGGSVKPLAKEVLMVETASADPGTLLTIASIFTLIAVLFIAFLIVSYLFSIMSCGNTIIYTVLRYKIDDENLLEEEEEEEDFFASEETETKEEEEVESEDEVSNIESGSEE